MGCCAKTGKKSRESRCWNAFSRACAIRARSHEEIGQKQAVQIAVVSLVVVAIFEIANLIVALLK